jgi:D-alanyl-D-alanine carboxypeptidase (penicillin-binding protein 5/6)
MKKLFTVIATFILMMTAMSPVLAASQPLSVQETTEQATKVTAKSAIAVDATTGQVLYNKDANTVRPIASMSKVIAAYLIMQSVKDGKMTWNQKISVNQSLEKVSENMELTNVPLSAKQTYTVKNLLDASLIYSANAAILALGKAEAGSSKAFVDQMQATVEGWGINDAKLYNAAGLLENQVGSEKYPGSDGNAENEMSAKDMAIVVSHVLKAFPEILKITQIQSATFDTGSEKLAIINHNELLKGADQYDQRYQIDGLKTGTSDKAGEDFTATGKINGHRIISVVLGAKEGKRFTDTKTIWNTLMTKLTPVTTDLSGKVTVKMNAAKTKNVKLKLATPLTYWTVKGQKAQVQVDQVKLKSKAKVPVSTTQVLATGKLAKTSSQFLEADEPLSLALKPVKKVAKANVFVRLARTIGDWFS